MKKEQGIFQHKLPEWDEDGGSMLSSIVTPFCTIEYVIDECYDHTIKLFYNRLIGDTGYLEKIGEYSSLEDAKLNAQKHYNEKIKELSICIGVNNEASQIKVNDKHPERGEIHIDSHGYFYRGNKINGVFEQWHENGQLASVINYLNGKREGKAERWYNNGRLKERSMYKKGKREGLCEMWHKNGIRKKSCNYKNGRSHGLFQSWDKDGEVLYILEFREGMIISS